MASLQRIRSHGALLIIIVGLAMLAFILGDFFSSSSSFFNRSREYVGTIAGEKVHITDYEAAREQIQEVAKIESGRNDLDEDMVANLNEQVWQMLVTNLTLTAQANKVGMTVTNNELADLCFGEHPHQLITQRRPFADQTGEFNRLALIQFLNDLDAAQSDPERAASMKQAHDYWMYWEKAVRLTYLQEKYNGLLTQLVKANRLDAKNAVAEGQTVVDAEYVGKMYYAVADSLVNVKNSEVSALYNKRKSQYKQDPNRTLEYVAFDIVPSEDDFAEVERWINRLKDEFATTDEVASLVNSNSDIIYDGFDYSESNIPARYKDFAFSNSAKAGDVTEVIAEDGVYTMARLMERGYSLPDSVELRYATVSTVEQLDSLKKAWAKGEFGDAAELGWLTASALPKEIADKAFAGQKNSIFSVENGAFIQVVQIMDKAAATPKVKLAILERAVTPSSKTYSALYNEAKQFSIQNNTEDKFSAAAEEAGLQVRPIYGVLKNAHTVGNLKQSRQLVRWAFGAKEGAVSDVFECGEQFIVALLKEVKDGDIRPYSDVSAELRQELVKDKKAELLIAELKNAQTLEEAANVLETEVKQAEGVSLSSSRFASAGNEPALVGTAAALAEGETSKPIKGNYGVYVVRTVHKAENATEADLDQQADQLSMRYMYNVVYPAINLIQKNAEIEDNRSNFY